MSTQPKTILNQVNKLLASAGKLKPSIGKQALIANLQAAKESAQLYVECFTPNNNPIEKGFGAAPDMEDLETIRQKAWERKNIDPKTPTPPIDL